MIKCILVSEGYKKIKINLNDIICIKGLSDYIEIILTTGKKIRPNIGLGKFEEKLKDIENLKKTTVNFIKIHRSYIINLNKVIEIENSEVLLENDIRIAMNKEYKEYLFKSLNYISKND